MSRSGGSVVLFTAALIAGLVTAGAGGGAPAAGAATAEGGVERVRFYDAAVNLGPDAPGAGGFAGGVRFHTEVGGATTVDVFLSRQEEVGCADGSVGVASTSVRTVSDEAIDPGPVHLDVDRRLVEASGRAVVDLLVEEDPGCGLPATTATLAAQVVEVAVTGTSERFFTGFGGGVSSGPDHRADLSYRFSRDGTGTVGVGAVVVGVSSDAAFVVHGIDRTRGHGTAPEAPASAAPPNGRGAQGFFARDADLAEGETGVVYEDAEVSAAVFAPPGRETAVSASSLVVERVSCADGTTSDVVTFVEGSGPATVTISTSSSSATTSASLQMTGFVDGGCAGAGPTEIIADRDVALDLTATGPEVRVTSTRWHLVPGDGSERSHGWYVARPATGTVTVGPVTGAPDGATIARAGPGRAG